MANSFHRVNRTLRADRGIRSTGMLLIALFLLGAWVTWAFQARLTRYVTSDSARLEKVSSGDPSGKLHVIGEFQPWAVLGQMRPGQSALFMAQGLSPAQSGAVPAHVSAIASEIRNGKLRVDLAIDSVSHSRFPLKAGLPVTVQVEVERLSPAALILRSAGDLAGAH